jgi:hypothetical protein
VGQGLDEAVGEGAAIRPEVGSCDAAHLFPALSQSSILW